MLRSLKRKIWNLMISKIMGTITHVSTQRPVVALTFDDGPDPQWTPLLLDILDSYQARATFFMIGDCARTQPGLVRQVAEAGHVIGNHSWNHSSFPLISSRERREQVSACADAISPYGVRLFRPPYGNQSLASWIDLKLCRYEVVTWNVHAYDWENRDAYWMADRLESQVRPGSIILLHDAICDQRYLSRKPMLDAVKIFLEHVGNRFSFITLPELFQYGHIKKEKWYMEPDIDWLNSHKRQDCSE
jgi:peptidoglycan/xylan/chitin deacetylase (PgdA/CDA1 family)